ncbi:MAG: phosphorylase [Alphaproteobacteria bacterium]|nr:phosphorylase [Alphaproteobacteria bacterium]
MPAGIVTGLASEAAIARRLWPDALIGCAASRPEKAMAEAARLADAGAGALLSFGIAGGLEPGLAPGTLVVATEIVTEDGRHPCHPALRDWLRALLPEARLAPVFGSDRPAASEADKASLRARGAFAVDMESAAVAAIASRRGLPFAVLRAIADPAERALPAAALDAVDDNGRPAIGRVLRALLRRPGDLPALLRLGRDSRLAHRSLEGLFGRAGLRLPVA